MIDPSVFLPVALALLSPILSPAVTTEPVTIVAGVDGRDVTETGAPSYVTEKVAVGGNAPSLLASAVIGAIEDGYSLLEVAELGGVSPGVEFIFVGPETVIISAETDSAGAVVRVEVATGDPVAAWQMYRNGDALADHLRGRGPLRLVLGELPDVINVVVDGGVLEVVTDDFEAQTVAEEGC